MKGIFVSGTTTGIGKTVASALLLMRATHIYQNPRYHKPIQTGFPHDDDAKTVNELQTTSVNTSVGIGFKKPISPHMAAYYDNARIDVALVINTIKSNCVGDFNIIEGCGGLLVPINSRFLVIDLIEKLDLSCVLVTSSEIGTINHTLLSIEALRKRNIPLHGIIMFGPKHRDNEHSIRFYGKVKNLIALPQVSTLNRETLARFVDDHAQAIDQFIKGI